MQHKDPTYGPFQCLTIITKEAVITISGENVSASFSFHDDPRRASRSLSSPPLSAVRHMETGRVESSATVGTRREGVFNLMEPETSSEDSDGSRSDEEKSSAEVNTGSDIESSQCESGPHDPDLIPKLECVSDMESPQCESGPPDPNLLECVCDVGSFQCESGPPDPNLIPKLECVSDMESSQCESGPPNPNLMPKLECVSINSVLCSSECTGVDTDSIGSSSASPPPVHSVVEKETVIDLALSGSHRQDSCEVKKDACYRRKRTHPGNGSFTHHLHNHTEEKPYSCDTCGKRFTRSWNLAVHLRTHTGEEPYSCDTCGKTFVQFGSLAVHLRTHTGKKPYSCDMCGKTFTTSGNLAVHLRTHTGEKPYSCGKRFSVSSSLVDHLRMHTGKKPYSSDTCGKASSSNS